MWLVGGRVVVVIGVGFGVDFVFAFVFAFCFCFWFCFWFCFCFCILVLVLVLLLFLHFGFGFGFGFGFDFAFDLLCFCFAFVFTLLCFTFVLLLFLLCFYFAFFIFFVFVFPSLFLLLLLGHRHELDAVWSERLHREKKMNVRLQLLLLCFCFYFGLFCFAFVFTLLSHSSHSHLSHLNRCRGFVANIGGMGERKTSFSTMPPATKQVWEPCPRAKLDVTFCTHVCFALSFDLCFLFCLLQPKKKGPANPRSKGAWSLDQSRRPKGTFETVAAVGVDDMLVASRVFVTAQKGERTAWHGIVANYIQVWSSWFFFASVLSNNLITCAVHFQGGSSADRRAMQGVMPKHLRFYCLVTPSDFVCCTSSVTHSDPPKRTTAITATKTPGLYLSRCCACCACT